jgi:hypothetical protein
MIVLGAAGQATKQKKNTFDEELEVKSNRYFGT